MRRMGGGASFCDPGFGRARNEKPPDGVPGVGFGGAGGMDGIGSGSRERRGISPPPREIPPRGVRKGGCGVSGLLLRIPGIIFPNNHCAIIPHPFPTDKLSDNTSILVSPPNRSIGFANSGLDGCVSNKQLVLQ